MARSGLVSRLRQFWRGTDRREPGLEPGAVNHVALGNHCHMAQILKETGLRTWSGPFDWIFSSPSMVSHCLADDFATLLDRSQYRSTLPDERPAPRACLCSHRYYAEHHGIVAVFNHHDPASVEADYRFLQEGVRRLRMALASHADNRFYLLASRPTPGETILGLAESLARYGVNNRLAVFETRLGESGAERVAVVPSNLTWLRVGTRSDSTGVRFADPSDDEQLRALVLELSATA